MESVVISLLLVAAVQAVHVYNVKDYGAKGDGTTPDTGAMRAALAAAASAGGGQVLVPSPGVFLTAPLNVSSNVELYIDEGAKILGIRDKDQYPRLPPLPSYGVSRDGNHPERYQALISSFFSHNVKINGAGTIDGNGDYWWNIMGAITAGRPRLIEIYNSTDIEISNIHMLNSGFWNLHPIYCRNAPKDSPNTDGVDPDSSTNVLVERVTVSCGDDHIAIKSGYDQWGRAVGLPCANVTVRDCSFYHGDGISIGSETSGGIKDIFILNNHVYGPAEKGLYIKTAPARGGVIERITYKNNKLDVAGQGIVIGMDYGRGNEAHPPPVIRDVSYEDITGSGFNNCGSFDCMKDSPCTGISFERVTLDLCVTLWSCSNVRNYSVSDVSPWGLRECFEKS